jgi:hypothetical protein
LRLLPNTESSFVKAPWKASSERFAAQWFIE